MTISTVTYSGGLRTEANHHRSGESLITDAPIDNEGRGEAFSPTDLLSTSLASCMLTLMGITAGKHNFMLAGARIEVAKEMLSNPRRVGRIGLKVTIEGEYSVRQKNILEVAALNCPVAKSIHPEIDQDVSFVYSN